MSDIFADRIAAVRVRFAAKFDARIDAIESTMRPLSDEDRFDALVLAHRNAHDLCGVGPTLGFVGTGQAARTVERLLLAAVNAERTLTDDETTRLREGIATLRSVGSAEMHPAGTA
jgi:hypothetical protein